MSSVLVKGMKMPENCEQCPFLIEDDIGFEVCRQCGAGKSGYIYEKDIDGFPSDCPLVALPDKHGRLVDADAMCNDLATVDRQYEQMVEWCISVTEAQPTIVEAEDSE